MTKKEIENRIKKEERHVKSLRGKITEIEFDISTTLIAIGFWKKELEKVEKAEKSA